MTVGEDGLYLVMTKVHMAFRVSDCCLMPNDKFFLLKDKNKLHFDDIVMFPLY